MKRTVIAGFIAALAFAGLAEPVSREQAETAARAWVRDGHAVGESLSSEVREVRFSDDGLPLYVADFAGGGFAVLASDTLCEPVVFYSGSGAFPSDPEHPIRALLAAEGLRLVQTVAAGGEPKPLWSRLLAPSRPRLMAASPASLSESEIRVAPLVKTHWNQQTFNDCTPGNKKGNITSGYFPLGCGPTALTQVMYTLRWPQDAVEPFTCTQSSISWADGTSEWRQFTAVGGTYDWDEMPLTYSEVRVNKEVRGRMAKFGLDVAIAFATQWREKSAGVTSAAVELWHGPMALTNFFHYSNAQFLSNTNSPGSSALPTELVIRAMKSNLDAHIPVIVEVHGTPGGHEIIADGYGYRDGTFYGHFNFGWAGTGDGWYVIPDIQEFSSVSGVMYNIFTIQPAGSSIASGRVLLSSAPVEGATVFAYDGEKRLVGNRILEEVRGRMMEDIVLLETSRALPKGKRAFKLTMSAGEFDMVIYDEEQDTCELYEIKHSAEIVDRQYHVLADADECALVEKKYGSIIKKCVLYRGKSGKRDNGIVYENVEQYLKSLK